MKIRFIGETDTYLTNGIIYEASKDDLALAEGELMILESDNESGAVYVIEEEYEIVED